MRSALLSLLTLALTLVGLSSSTAAVENLTGTWDVDLSCKGIDSGSTGKLKESSEVEIFDDGSGVVLVDWPGLFEFRAFLIPQAGKPDRGSLAGVNCDLSIDTLEGAVFTVDVKTRQGSDAAKLKGTLLRPRYESFAIFNCKMKGKRIASTVSKFAICPP